jgi:PAS domain S-box-containing protein
MSAALGTLAYTVVCRALHALRWRRSCQAHDELKQELFDRINFDPTLFNFLHAGSLDGLWYWNLEHPEQEWLSPRLKEVLGYQDRELPNTSAWWREMVFPEDLDLTTECFQRYCADPTYRYDHILRCRHRSGATVWIRCRGLLIRNAAGTPIRMLGAHTNVTAMQCIEARLGVRLPPDAGQELVWTCERDGRCDFLSEQWIGYTGIPAPAQLGFGWLEQVHADDRLGLWAASDAVATGTGSASTIEVRLRRRDGAFRRFDTRAMSLRDAEDQFGRMMAPARDMLHRSSGRDRSGADSGRGVTSATRVIGIPDECSHGTYS